MNWKDIKVTLTLGVDTPPRNNIKRLEGLNPNILDEYSLFTKV